MEGTGDVKRCPANPQKERDHVLGNTKLANARPINGNYKIGARISRPDNGSNCMGERSTS